MKALFVLCLLALQGCAPPHVHHNPALHDGRWGDYNEAMAEKCALDAMIAGKDIPEIEAMFNQCLFDEGLTI